MVYGLSKKSGSQLPRGYEPDPVTPPAVCAGTSPPVEGKAVVTTTSSLDGRDTTGWLHKVASAQAQATTTFPTELCNRELEGFGRQAGTHRDDHDGKYTDFGDTTWPSNLSPNPAPPPQQALKLLDRPLPRLGRRPSPPTLSGCPLAFPLPAGALCVHDTRLSAARIGPTCPQTIPTEQAPALGAAHDSVVVCPEQPLQAPAQPAGLTP